MQALVTVSTFIIQNLLLEINKLGQSTAYIYSEDLPDAESFVVSRYSSPIII